MRCLARAGYTQRIIWVFLGVFGCFKDFLHLIGCMTQTAPMYSKLTSTPEHLNYFHDAKNRYMSNTSLHPPLNPPLSRSTAKKQGIHFIFKKKLSDPQNPFARFTTILNNFYKSFYPGTLVDIFSVYHFFYPSPLFASIWQIFSYATRFFISAWSF